MDYIDQVIRRIRLSGLTRAEIAKRANVNPKTVGSIMAKAHSPTIKTLDKIEQVLKGVEV